MGIPLLPYGIGRRPRLGVEYYIVCHDCNEYAELGKIVFPTGTPPSWREFLQDEYDCPHYARPQHLHSYVRIMYFLSRHQRHKIEVLRDQELIDLQYVEVFKDRSAINIKGKLFKWLDRIWNEGWGK